MALTDEILQNIKSALASSLLDDVFLEDVVRRLDSFGYEVKESDAWMIGFAMQKVENHIKNECNTPDIHDGLMTTAVDMVCGEFLYSKKQSGQLNIESLDLDGAVSSIKTGDTSVNFDTGTSDEGKFGRLVDYLMNNGKGEFVCFRRMQW